ncbi:MAG: alpha/beta fold hydrolase [Pseudomonadales bacterium]
MKFVQLEQVRLAYEDIGRDTDPAFVLIRGLGTQLTDWSDAFIEGLLAQNLRVIRFDNRDVGLSTHFNQPIKPNLKRIASGEDTAPYTAYDMAADVMSLMNALSIERAHIFGISMGGMIAQIIAAKYPLRVLSLCSVMSSSGRSGLPGPSPQAQQALMRESDEASSADEIIKQTAEDMVIFGSPGYPETLQQRLARAGASYARSYDPMGVAYQMAAIVAAGSRIELLNSIAVATTVIHGKEDALIPLACGEDTAKSIANAVMIAVTGMGHNIPDALVPEMLSIVANHIDRVAQPEDSAVKGSTSVKR